MINTIVFDLGAVLIGWHPYNLYRKIFADEAEMEQFIANICTLHWNEEQDAGRSIADGTRALIAQYPEHEANIRAYYERWDEMLTGPIEGTLAILQQLRATGRYKIYALTNWSTETWPIALSKYDFLSWFDGIVVSGHEGVRKPNPAFYQVLFGRYDVEPINSLFIDDNLRNIKAAEELGMPSLHFTSPGQLKLDLEKVLQTKFAAD